MTKGLCVNVDGSWSFERKITTVVEGKGPTLDSLEMFLRKYEDVLEEEKPKKKAKKAPAKKQTATHQDVEKSEALLKAFRALDADGVETPVSVLASKVVGSDDGRRLRGHWRSLALCSGGRVMLERYKSGGSIYVKAGPSYAAWLARHAEPANA